MKKRGRTWTPEQRARQAEIIRQWQPWAMSTGPTTDEGKAKVARNAYSGGYWRKLRDSEKLLNQLLREQREYLQELI